MGEAKRRNAQARRVGDALRQRIAAGEFGAAGKAANYCFVLDKSPQGRDMLSTVRTMEEFAGLAPLLENEAFRFWEASSLFQFVVLCSGVAKPQERIFVAGRLEQLLGDVLPRAAKQLQREAGRSGFVLGVADEVQQAVQETAARLSAS